MSAKGSNNKVIRDCISRGLRLDGEEIILPSGRKHKGKLIKNGYATVSLWGCGKRSLTTKARIICWLTYGPPPTDSHEADHINRDRGDDRPENLRWADFGTQRRNSSPESISRLKERCRNLGRKFGGVRPKEIHKARAAIAKATKP